MKTKDEIQAELPNFYGTEQYYRYSPALFNNVLLTDGAKFIAESCNAFWLMDVISSHIPSIKKAGDTFAVAKLTVKDSGASFILVPDLPCDPREVFAKQKIEYTDFPLDEIKFYVQYDGEHWVIMLTSEY